MAHIGAIEELERSGFNITSVAGCSMGLHHLDVLTRKLQNSNIPIPETVEQERYYISGAKK